MTKTNDVVNNVCRILVGLDEVFDTRLGTLTAIHAEFAEIVGKSNYYYTRETDKFHTDEFGTLSVEKFLKYFNENRDLVLRNSLVTKIPRLIDIHINQVLSKLNDNPVWNSIELHLNVSPYKLTAGEMGEILKLFRSLISSPVQITIVNLSIEELTPDVLNSTYPVIYMYRYYELLETHRKLFSKVHCSNTMIYGPAVNFLDNTPDSVKEILAKEKTDIYEWTAKLINPYINIQFAPIGVFSAALPPNKT